jgi:hypothetical protein
MKTKRVLLGWLCLLLFNPVHAQLLNGDFEEWTGSADVAFPVDWDNNQFTFDLIRMEKDSNCISGDYCLKLIPGSNSGWQMCQSIVEQEVLLDQVLPENKSLYFYVKALPVEPGGEVFINVLVDFYDEAVLVDQVNWVQFDSIPEFQLMEIPFPNAVLSSLEVEIRGAATNGPADGCTNKSFVWLDAFFIANSTSVLTEERNQQSWNIYPNPANGRLFIDGIGYEGASYQLYNALGQLMARGICQPAGIPLSAEGLLFLVIETPSGIKRYTILNRN